MSSDAPLTKEGAHVTHIAESYVYESLDEDEAGNPLPGYVGRYPRGNFRLVGRPGATLTDEQVAALGLEDLKDHTDYEARLARAHERGMPITFRRDDNSIGLMISGKEATGNEPAWAQGGDE